MVPLQGSGHLSENIVLQGQSERAELYGRIHARVKFLCALCFSLSFLWDRNLPPPILSSFYELFPPMEDSRPNWRAFAKVHSLMDLHKQNLPVQPAPRLSVETAPQNRPVPFCSLTTPHKPPVRHDHHPRLHRLCLFFVLNIDGTVWNVLFWV